jgi:hypothetical protein
MKASDPSVALPVIADRFKNFEARANVIFSDPPKQNHSSAALKW